MIACHSCDYLHRIIPLADGGKACCARCGTVLYQQTHNSLNRVLALNLTALMLFIIANTYPFLTLKLNGIAEENLLISGVLTLYRMDMQGLAVLVFLTSIAFPLWLMVAMLYLLLPLRWGRIPPWRGLVYRMVQMLQPWSMLGVFMLAVLLAVVKLMDMATIVPGVALFSFMGVVLAVAAARSHLDHRLIWPHPAPPAITITGITARDCGLLHCHSCALLVPMTDAPAACPRCGHRLHLRQANMLARTWAWVVTALLLLIPANIYPIMTVVQWGQGEPNTIFSGVIHLIESGMWPLALIVFIASMVVPITKLLVLMGLLVSVQRHSPWRAHDRNRLYHITEAVGAWSMVDIFLIAMLAALVNLDALATVTPEFGASFFAMMVVATMFAAQSFDPRLIWDHA
ncbi:MAG: paraquat-inducible protein A [Mariprofundaceae bacterium]|nr:paraquat-inducible protein A [Mariprofundaceae bacterium]